MFWVHGLKFNWQRLVSLRFTFLHGELVWTTSLLLLHWQRGKCKWVEQFVILVGISVGKLRAYSFKVSICKWSLANGWSMVQKWGFYNLNNIHEILSLAVTVVLSKFYTLISLSSLWLLWKRQNDNALKVL